jgi:Glycoside hydrolase family 44
LNRFGRLLTVCFATALCLAAASCGSSGRGSVTTTTSYTLTVNSTTPASGVQMSYTENGSNVAKTGNTSFSLVADSGTQIILSAPSTANGNNFSSWTGCTTSSSTTCNVTLNANTTVTANYTTPTNYSLTINSTNPDSGVPITGAPSGTGLSLLGQTPFTQSVASGSQWTLTAPSTDAGNNFSSWSGCTTASSTTCNVTVSGNMTVTANYTAPTVTSVTVTPNPASATIGGTLQLAATVNGAGVTNSNVTWSVAAPSGSSLSPGTITSSGLYTTPYPAPATITVTATSVQDTSVSGSLAVTLNAPAAATGPALSVDAGNQTHTINPYIYGMNDYTLSATAAKAVNLPIDRWGGDATSEYNYKLDVTNAGSDWYFENSTSATGQQDTSAFNAQVKADAAVGAKTLGTVPVNGWVAKDGTSCSFPSSVFPSQYAFDPYKSTCGDGELPNQTNITGNDPTIVSTTVDTTWTSGWVAYLVSKFGNAASGGVAVYDLDNEPSWWDAVHRDVHPAPFTYDEVTNNGIAVAQAIKTADPTAEVSGPVMDWWWAYFYSKKDVESGWSSGGPCYQPWSNPVDREAHGGVPFIEYYLQQMAAYDNTNHVRLLDYLDLHTYFAPQYPLNSGNGIGLTTAGDTAEQQLRLDSTRVFWDSTYTDPDTTNQPFPQPNYKTDPGYTGTNCNVPAMAPQIIRTMHNWVNTDYPGTKLAITEYNWGGQESINGAVAQADILGIFGREALDIGTLWGPPDPVKQVPGLMAFEMYRNYDGNNSMFGDMSINSSSADQSQLAVYGALRTKDNTVTIVVINKTYGDLTTTLSVNNLSASTTSAQAYLYSNANLSKIMGPTTVTVTPPSGGSTVSTISTTFPAQSITLLTMAN